MYYLVDWVWMFHLYVDAHCPALSFSALSVKAMCMFKQAWQKE